jgi:excisionase family DNA binding protein
MEHARTKMTADELADVWKLQAETIRLWTRQGIIPAIRMTGKVVRYDPVEVEEALRRRSAERELNLEVRRASR